MSEDTENTKSKFFSGKKKDSEESKKQTSEDVSTTKAKESKEPKWPTNEKSNLTGGPKAKNEDAKELLSKIKQKVNKAYLASMNKTVNHMLESVLDDLKDY